MAVTLRSYEELLADFATFVSIRAHGGDAAQQSELCWRSTLSRLNPRSWR